MKTIKLENCILLIMLLAGVYSFGVAIFAASCTLELIASIYLGVVGVGGSIYLFIKNRKWYGKYFRIFGGVVYAWWNVCIPN